MDKSLSAFHLAYGQALATSVGADFLLLLTIDDAAGNGALHSAHTYEDKAQAQAMFMRLSWPKAKDAELWQRLDDGKWVLTAAEWHSVMVGVD